LWNDQEQAVIQQFQSKTLPHSRTKNTAEVPGLFMVCTGKDIPRLKQNFLPEI
jgi:hypothetical protein